MGEFRLSASLEGHSDDVRSVAFAGSEATVSASRDATVRIWKKTASTPPKYDESISSHGSAFINTVTYLPPNSDYTEGLIISGGKETIIDVRQPSKLPEDSADALLLGHSNNVCALDVDPSGNHIISGGWDGQGRIWKVGKWECDAVLEGHQGSVWAVLAWDEKTVLTGCADNLIRVFNYSGKLLKTIRGHPDVVRALCRIPPKHPSGADFASAGNDGIIRLWKLDGTQVGELHGHESFVYSLASLSSGELVSSGEDRSVKIWRGNECVQTITHPAISVWSVSANSETGDICSGASDRIVRVFSRSADRQADAETLRQFEESVKSSSIPQQQVGDVNKEKLPGPDFLHRKSGTKEGQVQMIREENGNVTAHQWSASTSQWISVGTVVDAVGSSGRKQDYQGKDYDYVFDVDIEDGKPPLKLPYNLSDNPYETAQKFIAENELPATYLDQVANFITTNTQGATLGSSSAPPPAGSDPLGTESRYRPGEVPSQPAPPPASRPKVLPQKTYLSIKQANLRTVEKKIRELNQQLVNEGRKDISLNPADLDSLGELITFLEHPSSETPVPSSSVDMLIQLVTQWPPAHRLPGLDLLRLLSASSPAVATYRTPHQESILQVLAQSGVFADAERGNNTMLAVRAVANLFETEAGQTLSNAEFDQIHELVKNIPNEALGNRNLTIAITTLYINYAVLLSQQPSQSRALALLEDLLAPASPFLPPGASDSEVTYRSLVAIGTLLQSADEEIKTAAKDLMGVQGRLVQAEGKVKEPRVKGIVGEIRDVLA